MNLPVIGKALLVCAALSLPALAAAPAADALPSARVIVKFKGDGPLMRESALAARPGELARVQHAARMSQRLGAVLRDGHAVAPRTQVMFASGISSADLVARLQADPDVEYAEVDVRMRRAAAPNDPRYPGAQPTVTPTVGQWYLRRPVSTGTAATNGEVSSINAEEAWDLTLGSPAIVVAVLDTGVRMDHPDLAGKLVRGYDFVSEDSTNNFATANDGDGRDADPSDPGDWVTAAEVATGGPFAGENCQGDSSWHGTQTASLVAAATNEGVGMAGTGRNVRVMPVRVLGKCGGFASDVIAGMYWAAGLAIPASPSILGTAPPNPMPAKVLNLSLGGSSSPCSQTYQDAVNAVTAAGASVVVAAGNGGGTTVGQPANCTGAIGVGGLRHAGTKSGFSDQGSQIALAAPAGNCGAGAGACQWAIITATNGGTTVPTTNHTYSDGFNASFGTSFSAPMVAGTAALMLTRNPSLTPAQVRSTLQSSARAFPTTGGTAGTPVCPAMSSAGECYCTNATCGAGMLDARAAVLAAGQPSAPRALIFTTPAVVLPNPTVVVDGSTSVGGSGTSINQYLWSLPVDGGIATLQGSTTASTATIALLGEGSFTVRLRVTDANNVIDTRDLVVTVAAQPGQPSGNPTNPPSGGGGMWSWPWLLALGIAVAALRPRGRTEKL